MTGTKGAVLITGAAKRIGRTLALDLANAGWAVAVHFNASADEAAALVREIGNDRAASVAADLTNEEATQGLVAGAASALGRPITALVNNASLFEDDQWDTVTKTGWDAHFAVNLRAPFLLCQAFARALPKDNDGAVVNIVDQRVWKLTPQYMSYTLSKSALWTMTRTLAQALAPRIRVNAVGPGPVLQSTQQTNEAFARQTAAVPLGHGAAPREIAAAVRYLLDAPSVTGQMIAVDGGQHLAWQTADVVGVD